MTPNSPSSPLALGRTLLLGAVFALLGCGPTVGASRPDAGKKPDLVPTVCQTDLDCDDGVGCTADLCDPALGCKHQTQDSRCDDRIGCTVDSCDLEQGCLHSPDDGRCGDGIDCTGDVCDPLRDCQHTADSTRCNDQNGCTDDLCSLTAGCTHTGKVNGTACDDQTLCNGRETCQQSTCTPGAALDCDDGNPCTADACDVLLGCSHTPIADGLQCDDGNACNGTETCRAGTCRPGTAPTCTSNDPCQAAACRPDAGCVLEPLTGTACEDGNVCNGADRCVDGRCTHPTPLVCNPTDACHSVACQPTQGCVQTALSGNACDDSNVCNGADTCLLGTCTHGGPPNCDDQNPCTADSCSAAGGCTHTPLTGSSCENGNVCDGLNTCQAGVCTAGTPLNCPATDACHIGSCDPTRGCVQDNALDGTGCDDANTCNGADSCAAGVCTHAGGASCDDQNPCTTDGCDPQGGCTHEPLTGTSCENGNVCDGLNTCQAGVCTAGTTLNCPATDACHVGACDPSRGCIQTDALDGTGCDDRDACNGADSCAAGVCTHAGAPDCDDSSLCTTDACDPTSGCTHAAITCNDGIGCTTDSCDPATGCTATPDNLRCSSPISCMRGICAPTSGDPSSGCYFLADDNLCNDTVACTADYCDPTFGCSTVSRDVVCLDALGATGDRCTGAGCTHPATPCAKPPLLDLVRSGAGLINGTTVGATGVADPETQAPNCSFVQTGKPEQFYALELPNWSRVTLHTLASPDSGFDSVLYVRGSSCGATPQAACSDDGKWPDAGSLLADGGYMGLGSWLETDLTPGRYHVVVDSYGVGGGFQLSSLVRTNESCSLVRDIGSGGQFTGDTAFLANDSSSSPTGMCAGVGYGGDAVFKVTVPAGRTRMNIDTKGSAADVLVYVRKDLCSTGDEVACMDDTKDARGNIVGRWVDLRVDVVSGATYFLFLDKFSTVPDGPYVLNVSFP